MQAPINSFLLFCKDYRTIIATNYPDLSNSDVTSMLGSYWRNLEEGIKNNYVLKARDLNKEFYDENPDYVRKPKCSDYTKYTSTFKIQTPKRKPLNTPIQKSKQTSPKHTSPRKLTVSPPLATPPQDVNRTSQHNYPPTYQQHIPQHDDYQSYNTYHQNHYYPQNTPQTYLYNFTCFANHS